MCEGDDKSCPEYESHRLKQSLSLDLERRSFVKSAFGAAGGVAALGAGGISLVTPEMARAAAANQPAKRAYHHLPATSEASKRPNAPETGTTHDFRSVREGLPDGSKNANSSYNHAGLDVWTVWLLDLNREAC